MYSQRSLTEIFHLLFLQRLSQFVDKRLYTLKGGCNLRFYFQSIRFSEDIDLDIHGGSAATLQKNINKLLNEKLFAMSLQTRNLQLSSVNPSKQTDTTQRWKMVLYSEELQKEFNTKIEFSRRESNDEHSKSFEAVDPEIIARYRLRPVLTQRYDGEAALQQKIQALIGRSQAQTRDVFDIKLLLDAGYNTSVTPDVKESIENRLLLLRYEDYYSQVVTYLEPEYQSFYETEKHWDSLLETIAHHFVEA